MIYAGATILGRVTIGHGSTIGGNVWLTRSVPPGSNIAQAQVRTEEFDEGARDLNGRRLALQPLMKNIAMSAFRFE